MQSLIVATYFRDRYLGRTSNNLIEEQISLLFLCKWACLACVDIRLRIKHRSLYLPPRRTRLQPLTAQMNQKTLVLVCAVFMFIINTSAEFRLGFFSRSEELPPSTLLYFKNVGYGTLFPLGRLTNLLTIICSQCRVFGSGQVPSHSQGLCHLGLPRKWSPDRSSFVSCSLRGRPHSAAERIILENQL